MEPHIANARTPGLLRRVAAILYDLMLLFGVLVVAAALVIVPWVELVGPAFPHGAWWFRMYLLSVIFGYFVFFWGWAGQTLGMRAWRMKLLRGDGGRVRMADALRRLVWATLTLLPAGAGLLWVLFDRQGFAWYDRLSGTRLVLLARQGSGAGNAAG